MDYVKSAGFHTVPTESMTFFELGPDCGRQNKAINGQQHLTIGIILHYWSVPQEVAQNRPM